MVRHVKLIAILTNYRKRFPASKLLAISGAMAEFPSDSQSSVVESGPLAGKEPDFYCCYLLRSICKRGSFYIGSTPNPIRRLRQHNGHLARGGAYRTKREGTRPWEMLAIVYGFPNRTSALQFEHAWQHAYHTHYIVDSDRLVKKKGTGRTIHHKLGVVRQLIKHVYFQCMDLTVHFFNSDAKDVWDLNKFKIQIDNTSVSLAVSIGALSGQPNITSADAFHEYSDKNLQLVEQLYNNYVSEISHRSNLYRDRLQEGEIMCGICEQFFDYTSEGPAEKPRVCFCPNEDCTFTAHLRCMHRYFLDDEQLSINGRNLTPRQGVCPACSRNIPWTVLVKYSNRLRWMLE